MEDLPAMGCIPALLSQQQLQVSPQLGMDLFGNAPGLTSLCPTVRLLLAIHLSPWGSIPVQQSLESSPHCEPWVSLASLACLPEPADVPYLATLCAKDFL